MPHPFKVGGIYRNRKGQYEVISIVGDEMVIRYENGSKLQASIVDLQRIWENIQSESAILEEREGKSEPTKRSRTVTPHFHGFRPDDFGELAGSSWRSQNALGGVISQYLKIQTGLPFKSWGVNRRLEMHVARADRYNFDNPHTHAKLFVYSHDDLSYGFYIETPSVKQKPEFPDRYKDWERFKEMITTRATMQAVLLEPMSNHGLMVTDYYSQDTGGALGCKFKFIEGSLHWWRPNRPSWIPVDVDTMFQRIARLPEEEYVDVHVFTSMSQQEAIEKGVQVITPILEVLRALTPLYQMTVG